MTGPPLLDSEIEHISTCAFDIADGMQVASHEHLAPDAVKIERCITLMKAACDYLKQVDPGKLVRYDDANCDGQCLMDDISEVIDDHVNG